MSARLVELDWQRTPMGEVTLRRRFDPLLRQDVYEVILGDEHLMSSYFTVAEIELAHLGLDLAPDRELDVLVGGLGLGYTARAVLEHDRVRSLVVLEAIDVVIDWHVRGLLPISAEITADPRTTLELGDFFAHVREREVTRRFDAILLDVDHTPSHHLHPSHAPFYSREGLQQLKDHLTPGGVFALWSDALPDAAFTAVLGEVFEEVRAEVVPFDNPRTGGRSSNSIYLAR
ncbi:spermidine synthase [Serinibacter arcticus]|uniref:Spermidine synthase n=1 Tax=Serinibacter arcticus TaxID=1655435 RepID=A0A2U1ZRB1_9MICO|nr:spermidine synthase [Serinibacter arcticus]PWD49535.1 spermidine synthase [Serinibacter arcticus]